MEADILKAGVILVDLPGQGDSNPARAKVADNYMQRSDGLVIVMEATRAVDNKTGAKILKKKLEHQLIIDGLNQNGTVVLACTKTDVGNYCAVFVKPTLIIRRGSRPTSQLSRQR